MTTYLISDIHLQHSEPATLNLFLQFMEQQAPKADAVYILGDLFEAWIGDDDESTLAQQVCTALLQLTQQGVPCYFMRGNRDVAIGDKFCQRTGVTLLDDPYLAKIYNHQVLLMHGDLLCTDDAKYQAFRRKVHDPKFRKRFLSLPLFIRRTIAAWARWKSKKHTSKTSLTIQDVNKETVNQVMRKYQVELLIHGHTHRPATHKFQLDDKMVERIVLSAWHDAGYVLSITPDWKINETKL